MKSFGASGPYNDVYKHSNITADYIVKKVQEKLKL
jgi:Transketolase